MMIVMMVTGCSDETRILTRCTCQRGNGDGEGDQDGDGDSNGSVTEMGGDGDGDGTQKCTCSEPFPGVRKNLAENCTLSRKRKYFLSYTYIKNYTLAVICLSHECVCLSMCNVCICVNV